MTSCAGTTLQGPHTRLASLLSQLSRHIQTSSYLKDRSALQHTRNQSSAHAVMFGAHEHTHLHLFYPETLFRAHTYAHFSSSLWPMPRHTYRPRDCSITQTMWTAHTTFSMVLPAVDTQQTSGADFEGNTFRVSKCLVIVGAASMI